MNVKDYRYIVEIAEQKSISKAAAVLYITQSALTRFLQRVEDELGASLFFRQGNHLVLTEVGQCYVERGRKIIELDYEAEEEISKLIQQKKQYIRIGYGFGRTDYITAAVLKPFFEIYKDVQIDVRLGSAESRLRMVERNELDLAVVTSRDYRPGLVYCQVGKVPLILAVPSHSCLLDMAVKTEGLKYPSVELRDWIGEPFVQLSTVTYSGKVIREFFKKNQVKPQVCLEINDVRSALKAVENGIGNCIFWEVPRGDHGVEYLSMREFAPPPQQLYVAYRSDVCISPAISYMIQLIRNAF